MTYNAVPSVSTGDLWTAANANTYWRDNFSDHETRVSAVEAMSGILSSYCLVNRTTNQSILNATSTAISFNNEIADTGNYFDAGSPTRLTISDTGIYLVGGSVYWETNVNGSRIINLISDGVSAFYYDVRPVTGTGGCAATVYGMIKYTTPGYLELSVWQGSGIALNALAHLSYFWVLKIA